MQTQEKILAVDDDPNNVAILEELLENDYDLKVATNGEQALKIAQDFRPDIALVDIMMPGMNGYEVCRRLREDAALKHTKIIMVSARAMVSERLQGYEAGADDYITKPFDGDEFLAKIRVYLRLKHAEEIDRIRDEITVAAMETLSAPVLVARKIISEIDDNAFGEINPELRHQLDTADWCMDDLERIIHSFLDVSQIYAGTVQLQSSQFSMQSVVQEVVDALKPQASSKEIVLNTDMPGEELLVDADQDSIFKILENLIGEIIRVTHGGNGIWVRVKDLEGAVGVEIEGSELCTEASSIDDLFNPFDRTQRHVPSGGHGGGFGFAVAMELAELHGGRIRIDERSDGSNVFEFEIPIREGIETTEQHVTSDAGCNFGAGE